ncbi:hypothetical protein I4U23_010927 [Adineta vaga]|nr:hypothetical protein I4U23_010927 [Adineta vaga]
MAEDCLYLNIFTALSNNLSSRNLLPVMIYISGGNFGILNKRMAIVWVIDNINTFNHIIFGQSYGAQSTVLHYLTFIDNDIVHGILIHTIPNVSFLLKPFIIGTLTDECYDMIYSALKTNMTVGLFDECDLWDQTGYK